MRSGDGLRSFPAPNPKAHQERKNQLQIISMTLQSGQNVIVGKRLREILSAARKHPGAAAS